METMPGINYKALENKLLQAAAGYKGAPNIEQQLIAEAHTNGLDAGDAKAIVAKVLKRLNKTEQHPKQTANAFGVAHKAQDRFAAIRKALSNVVI
jgi:hypothetical protein